MAEYMYCEWKVNKAWRMGFVDKDRLDKDIPLHTIRSLNGPHSQDTVNEFLAKWHWKSLERRV